MTNKELCNKIKHASHKENYLPQYKEQFANLYYDYASIQLAFSYYTLYEMLHDDEDTLSTYALPYFNRLKECMAHANEETTKNELHNLRQELITFMQEITTYTDTLQIYEYILNRIEAKYSAAKEYNIDFEIQKIITFLFADKEPAITNDKIKSVVSELPIRMTKNRFYDILSQCIDIYKGSDQASVESFAYMIRTSGMLSLPDMGKDTFAATIHIDELVETFKNTDFKTISHQEYDQLREQLDEVTNQLNSLVNGCLQCQEAINHFYTMEALESLVTTKETSKIYSSTSNIIKTIQSALDTDETISLIDACGIYLEQLEGKQEQSIEQIMAFEGVLDDLLTKDAFKEELAVFELCEKLLSSSLFIELEDTENTNEADADYIVKTKETLISEFKEVFAANKKEVNRGIMAAVIGQLPVFFQTKEEVIDYVTYALKNCSNDAELQASLEVIHEIME